MYIMDGIAYAGEKSPEVQAVGVRALPDYKLWVRFNTGEAKIFDFRPLLDRPAYAPLKDEGLFRQVYIDYGVPTWQDGAIDIAPEKVYKDSVPAEDVKRA